MITIPSPRTVLVPSFFDSKLGNYYISGSNIVIESIANYLTRVDKTIRPLGAIITILIPKLIGSYGSFSIIEFETIIKNYDIKYYRFENGVEDENFKELIFGGDVNISEQLKSITMNIGYVEPLFSYDHTALYNRYTVLDPRNIAPVGYKIPSNAEFVEMFNVLEENEIPVDYTTNPENNVAALIKSNNINTWLYNFDYIQPNVNSLYVEPYGIRVGKKFANSDFPSDYGAFWWRGEMVALWSEEGDVWLITRNKSIYFISHTNEAFDLNHFGACLVFIRNTQDNLSNFHNGVTEMVDYTSVLYTIWIYNGDGGYNKEWASIGNYITFRDLTKVPYVADNLDWVNTDKAAYCYYLMKLEDLFYIAIQQSDTKDQSFEFDDVDATAEEQVWTIDISATNSFRLTNFILESDGGTMNVDIECNGQVLFSMNSGQFPNPSNSMSDNLFINQMDRLMIKYKGVHTGTPTSIRGKFEYRIYYSSSIPSITDYINLD